MMVDLPFAAVQGCRILGTKGTGKTRELIARVMGLLAQGTAPEDILVLAATPTSALRFRELLVEACAGDGATGEGEAGTLARQAGLVPVTTARQLALDLLDTEAAHAATGRHSRMITAFESAMVMEDMKTCGMQVKRLREMLKFLERGWTEFSDENPSWLIDNEERDLQALYRDYLALYEVMPEAEIANLALKYLRFDEGALEAARRPWVFMDDYQLMNRTSQLLGLLVAGRMVTIAADGFATAPVFDSYPYAAGIEEFSSLVEGVQTLRLAGCKRGTDMARITEKVLVNGGFVEADAAMRAEDSPADGAAFTLLEAPSPKQEFAEIVSWVEGRLAAGTAAEDVAIIHPDAPLWGRYAVQALEAAGHEVSVLPDARGLAGDPRKPETSTAMQLASLLLLAGDAEDSLAWRCWCGYGDWLTESATFETLRRYAGENRDRKSVV